MYLEYSYLLRAVLHCSLDSELQALAAFLPEHGGEVGVRGLRETNAVPVQFAVSNPRFNAVSIGYRFWGRQAGGGLNMAGMSFPMKAFGGALYAAMRAFGGGGLGVNVIHGLPVQFAVSNSRHNAASIWGGLGQLGGGFGFAGLVGSACPLCGDVSTLRSGGAFIGITSASPADDASPPSWLPALLPSRFEGPPFRFHAPLSRLQAPPFLAPGAPLLVPCVAAFLP